MLFVWWLILVWIGTMRPLRGRVYFKEINAKQQENRKIQRRKALRERKPPQRPKSRVGKVVYGEHIVSWFDLETCSKIIEDGAIGQDTYDFLLVYYSNWPYLLPFLRYSQFNAEMTLLGDCDL